MKAQNLNLVALAAAALFTVTGLAAINSNVSVRPVSEVNGVKVVDLAPVTVRPSADDLRAAALIGNASAAIAVPGVVRGAESGASLLGAQLAMPYYSFGTKFGRITKE
ncbi:hypothetical protein ASG87_18670 [Frateuria sp. Soil773]|uniref:hypothetical protein n=1 Tax=Frateuria sp. Soil773 TaxID=1736407 RepID=UPI0007001352|nr:hypothetical protein [Frateuria sp. Soil773]KRE90578.1 hypothetical protein ASG87_18670 [Frateuria sp. Soil773]